MPISHDTSNAAVEVLRSIEEAGVDIFHFAFYPEGEKMLEFNSRSNPNYFLTRFSSAEALESGSSLSILSDFAKKIHPYDSECMNAYIESHLMVAAQQLGGETVTNFRSERFRVKSSGADDWRWYEIRSRLCAENAELIVVEGVFTDVTDLVLADTVDAETSCLNLKGFNLRLDDLLSESDLQCAFPIAFVNVGFDGFGAYEACFGVAKANDALAVVAETLINLLPSNWLCSSLGRGGFLICAYPTFVSISDYSWRLCLKSELEDLVYKMNKCLAVLNGMSSLLPISIGVSASRVTGKADVDRLMLESASAAYQASTRKNNKLFFYSKDVSDRVVESIHLQKELDRALLFQELKLLYQPQHDFNGRIVGAEALIRFPGLPGPDTLIPLAEQTGQIFAIGEFVVRQCVADMKLFKRFGLKKMSLNVSPAQLGSGQLSQKFLGMILQAVDEADLSPIDFEIEMTETAIFDSDGNAHEGYNLLSKAGFSLALDDFGAGYSSLALLRTLPIGKLKIDGSFVDNIVQSIRDQSLIQAVAHICKDLRMTLLAEKVEDRMQVDVLRRLGISMFQGYYFSRPLAAGQFVELMQS